MTVVIYGLIGILRMFLQPMIDKIGGSKKHWLIVKSQRNEQENNMKNVYPDVNYDRDLTKNITPSFK